MKSTPAHLRAAGILLVAGWIAFWSGAVNPWAWDFFTSDSVHEFLSLVAASPTAWLAIAAAFAVGVLLTLAGLILLTTVLRERGECLWSELGRSAFLLGSALWLVSLGFRATATVPAARATLTSGAAPDWYLPLRDWSAALFALYMVLAYLAVAAYGRSLQIAGIAPRWAKVHLYFGLAAAVGFVARVPVFDPPLMVHIIPGIFGVVLVMKSVPLAASASASTD